MNTNQPSTSAIISPLPSLIGTKELLRISTNLYWSNIWLLIGVAGVFLPLRIGVGVASYILGGIVYSRSVGGFLSPPDVLLIVLELFLIFVWIVIFAWFRGSLTIAASEIGSGGVTTLKKALKDGWLIKWSFLFVMILFGLAVIGGMILLIIPGIIFIIWYFFHPYVLVCENLKGRAVLSRSRELVRGYWWGVTIHVLVLFAMVGGIALIISFIIPSSENSVPSFERFVKTLFYQLVALPFSTIYFFILYKNLKTIKG